jgi:hypothetical protein
VVDVYFVIFEEYFRCSCNSLYAGEDKDNYNLDMSTQGEIVIWAFLYLSFEQQSLCLKSLSYFGYVDCKDKKTVLFFS